MKVAELLAVLEQIAPLALAESWDNAGLLVGDPALDFTRILLTIDYTSAVAEEAKATGCDMVIAYHPPIFSPLKRVAADDGSSLVFDAIRRGIAIYSPHTALDAAVGGTNDLLADAIGVNDRKPLRINETSGVQYKLVVFVPEDQLSVVRDALFAAGAGHIGKYSSCSFRSAGTGTFFGEAGSKPALGESGRLESVAEIRLETLVPTSKLDTVLKGLRQSHPYEEPAFDLIQLARAPALGLGQGRVGSFSSPVMVPELVRRIKRELQLDSVLVSGADSDVVSKAAICAGAGGELLDDAISHGADFYLTGELRHHDAIKAKRAGMTVVCTLHSNSERPILKRLKGRIEEKLAGAEVLLSQADRDPFSIK